MLNKLPRPTIFAHRGASAYAPENTLPAFELAVRQGVDVIELDVKLTGDGKVVVFHDQTLDRITGNPIKVKHCSLAELLKFDAGSHFDTSFRGEPIPTLEKVFKSIGDQCYYNIELTNYDSLIDSLPERVAELIQKHKLTNHILISSFNPIAILRFRRYLPDIPIALLARPGKHGTLARSRLGYLLSYQALHIALKDTTSAIINRAHQRRCLIHIFTVNQAEEIRRIIETGADGFLTDDPLLAKRIRKDLSLTMSD